MTSVVLVEHPLVSDLLARARDERTRPPEFRRTVGQLAALLTYEAARNWPTEAAEVLTPLGVSASFQRLASPSPVLVPILRAGLGMLEGAVSVLPESEVGVIGLRRDEVTFLPDQYCEALPGEIEGRHAVVLDPMIATGGTIAKACERLVDRGAGRITAICLIAAPEGLAVLGQRCPRAEVVTAAVDPRIDARSYIVPGLGDAGDRQYGRP
jgi:uracil phosphoribosyltransferase